MKKIVDVRKNYYRWSGKVVNETDNEIEIEQIVFKETKLPTKFKKVYESECESIDIYGKDQKPVIYKRFENGEYYITTLTY